MLHRKFLALIVLLILALAACGGEEEEPTPVPTQPPPAATNTAVPPTATPAPTNTAVPPTNTPAPTATPDVTANFTELSDDLTGITISYPGNWGSMVNETTGEIRLASDETLLNNESIAPGTMSGTFVLISSFDAETADLLTNGNGSDPVALLNAFKEFITSSAPDTEFTITQEPTATEINGLTAALMTMDVVSPQDEGVAQFAAIAADSRMVLAFGAAEASEADAFPATFAAMLDTLEIGTPAVVAEPTPQPTAVPVAEPIRQWATSATASSEYSSDNWSADQATGAPDVDACGDNSAAWASLSSFGVDTLEVSYKTAVQPSEINIYQTYNPNQVTLVEVVDQDGNATVVYEGTPEAITEPCPFVLTVPVEGVEAAITSVRITVDQSVLVNWNEIDAVELVGIPVEGATTSPIPFEVGDLPQPTLEPGFTMYTNANGVRDIAVYDGILYAATDGGVVLWDLATGEPLRKMTTLDGLLHNVTDAVAVCDVPDTRVVIGTNAGINLYDPATDTLESWTPENSGMGSDYPVDTLVCVPDMPALVIGYDLDGVDVYNVAADEWTRYEPFDALESGFAESIAVKGNLEEIWVAHIGGVSVIRPDGVTYYDDENSNLDDPSTDDFEHFVNAIVVDQGGTVWFGTEAGLTRVDGDNQFTFFNGDSIEGFPFFSSVKGLAVGPDGSLWTNAVFGGVCNFDPASNSCLTTFEDEDGMAGDFNSEILVDENGIYYASDGSGASYYNGSEWQNFLLEELPVANTYRAVAQGIDGSVWVGGFYGLQSFYAYDANSTWQTWEGDLDFVSVNTFLPTDVGMWVGHSNGASFIEFATGDVETLETADSAGEGIYNGSVNAIEIDSTGNYWFGTSNGVTVWDGSTFTYYDLLTDEQRANGDYPPYVYDIQAQGEMVWVATSSALFGFDAAGISTRYDTDSDLPFFPGFYALALDVDGNLLVAVSYLLTTFDGQGDFVPLFEADSTIYSILAAADGSITLGTDDNGVLYYDGANWSALTTTSGLPTNRFTGIQSVMVDYLGTAWLAGSEGGLVRVTP